MPEPTTPTAAPMTDAERIADLERRLAALEAPSSNSGIADALVGLLYRLGTPNSVLMGQVRTGLAAVGAAVAARGYATSSQASDVAGALMVILAAVWSAASKWIEQHWLRVAIAAPETTPVGALRAIVAAHGLGPVTPDTVRAAVTAVTTAADT